VDDFLKVVGAAVAVLASLAAVALAIDQFTLRSRLRKTEEWAAKALDAEVHDNRRQVLAGIREEATARIVAGLLVPVWYFVEPVGMSVLGPFVVATVFRLDDPTAEAVAIAFVGFAGSSVAGRRLVHVHAERRRVASRFRRGLEVVSPRASGRDWMVGEHYSAELLLGSALALCTCILGAGVGFALSAHQFGGWPLVLVVAGLVGAPAVWSLVDARADRKHPARDAS
jgi:hypothetical protein